MKAALALTTALSSIAAAFPLMPWIQLAPPPAGTLFYTLQAKSATTAINNQYLTLPSSSSSYTLTSTASAATKFFVQKYNATNTYAFHNADDTRQLALRGSNGTLLYMVDVTSPNADNIPAGQLMEWATFTFDQNVLAVKDGSTLTTRQWVAVGSGSARQVALWDGVTNTTQAVATLTLNVVRATGA